VRAMLVENNSTKISKTGSYVKVVSPSKIANLSPIFGVFGLVHNAFKSIVEIKIIKSHGIDIKVDGMPSTLISYEPEKSTMGYVAKFLVYKLPIECGLNDPYREEAHVNFSKSSKVIEVHS
jgi:homoserine kinase